MARIESFSFTPPPDEIAEAYEGRKTEFQNQFYEETISRLRGDDSKEEDEKLGPVEVVEEILSNGGVEEYLKVANNGREYIDADLIEIDYELSARNAKKTKKLLARETGRGEG